MNEIEQNVKTLINNILKDNLEIEIYVNKTLYDIKVEVAVYFDGDLIAEDSHRD